MQSRKTAGRGFKVRLKVAVGLGAVLVASTVASPFAAASVPHGAVAASHFARVGSSRDALVPLPASSSRQGTRALVVVARAPVPLWPHWGGPIVPLVAVRTPRPLWPHWGGPIVPLAAVRTPRPLWPHWGGPIVPLAAVRTPRPLWPHWGGPKV
jgi:hypothetical protein